MNNSQGNDSGSPSQPTPQLPSQPLPSLDALALAEWLAGRRAAGDFPRLSDLIAGMPDAAGDLADAMMDAMDTTDDVEIGTSEADADARPEEIGVAPILLSPGAERGVAAIFGAAGAGDITALAGYQAAKDGAGMRDDAPANLARVAEASAPYIAMADEAAGEPLGLLALAQGRQMEVEALAAQVMLSPDALRWLDRMALPPERQPDALVFHLVGALGTTSERVRAALAQGETSGEEIDPAGMLATDESLTAAQRAYWATLLGA